jgi:hypothetical protein
VIGKTAVRIVRKVPMSLWAYALWSNRQDARRWGSFVGDVLRRPKERSARALLSEARVRAAVTRDPILRRDPMLTDVNLTDGLVTLSSSSDAWQPRADRLDRLKKVKGVDVMTQHPRNLTLDPVWEPVHQ